jgi:4-hydroxybenzoate polyprenyltransferase
MLAGGGRAARAHRLALQGDVAVELLPYDEAVLAKIRDWRAQGGRVALVSSGDRLLAERVAAHLGLFDEVHGSDGAQVLEGAAKAELLAGRYGAGGYAYLGHAAADLPSWAGAGRRITANARPALRARVAALGAGGAEHLGSDALPLGAWVRALRPHQWVKNVLVFLPMLASHALSWSNLSESLLAFVAFCLVASSVYLLNDLLDLSADRDHPRKRHRPLASGAVPIRPATGLALGLLAAGMVLALALGPRFAAALAIYFVVTAAYSLHLKRRTIIDIWILAILYSMRIVGGAAATGIVPSVWLMAFSIFFFFSLAAVKRQAELVDTAENDTLDTRRRGYYREDLLLVAMMALASGYVSVLVLALYIRTPFIEELYGYPPVLLGICLVLLYWISRIVMVTHRGQMHDDPLVFALRDRVSHGCMLLCVAIGALAYNM